MSRWALVIGAAVVTVVESDAAPTAQLGGQWVADPAGQAQTGGTRVDGAFVAPPAAIEVRHVTQLAFDNRFTDDELDGIEAAADAPGGQPLKRRLKKLAKAGYVDLDRADTRAGVEQLEALGLLAAGRATQILDAPVQAHERP